jgi:hypothetical protein
MAAVFRSRPSLRVIVFGTTAGAFWSVVPGGLSELFDSLGESISVVISGMLTGILVSAVLFRPLQHVRITGTLFLGFLSLPVGAFVFGVIISIVQLLINILTGISYRFIEYGFKPLHVGIDYAGFSIVSIFALALIPLAIFTTTCLKWSLPVSKRQEAQET